VIPGIVRSHYSFEPKTIQGGQKWFCVYEAEFVNEAAMEVSLASMEAQTANADIVNYSPEPPTALIYTLKAV